MSQAKSLSLLLLLGALASAATVETVLNERDQKALAKEVRAYWDAVRDTKGIHEAYADLDSAIEKTEKKVEGRGLLTLVDDWERIFYEASAAGHDERGLKKGKLEERTTQPSPSGEEVHYWLYVPPKYSLRTGPYRLLITVPDQGQTPEKHLAEEYLDQTQRDSTIIACPRMPSNTAAWTAYDPTGPLDGVLTIMLTYGNVFSDLAVDVDRVFLSGKGAGMAAALAAARAYPHLFAGVVGRGAAPESIVALADSAGNSSNLPTLFIDAGTHATTYQTKAKELGVETCTHETGKTEADVWAWMGGIERVPYPTEIAFRPPTPYTKTAYWLELEGINVEEGPHATASVDRESNTIRIEGHNVSTVKLFLNDALVDLGQPVKVVVNGVEHQELPGRNAKSMIDFIFYGGDWGRVFTAFPTFDVPVKAN